MKVGDRVKVVNYGGFYFESDYCPVGHTGTITEIGFRFLLVDLDEAAEDCVSWLLDEKELEVINES